MKNGWLMLGKLCAVRKEGGHRSGWGHDEAICSLKPQQHLECDTFKNCQGLSRVACLDGNGWLMLGTLCALRKKGGHRSGWRHWWVCMRRFVVRTPCTCVCTWFHSCPVRMCTVFTGCQSWLLEYCAHTLCQGQERFQSWGRQSVRR